MAVVTVVRPDSVGGYEYEFVEEVPDKFLCMICTKPLRDPNLTGCCGQHFCNSCLQQWLKEQKKEVCPYCRTENFPHMLNKAHQREIAALKVYCTHKTRGCQWTGELNSLDNHLEAEDGCGFVLILCTNKCWKCVRRKNLYHHLTEECFNRMYQCEHCGLRDTYVRITEGCDPTADGLVPLHDQRSHYEVCELFPLQCPNNCGADKIKRKDMSAHQDMCPREKLICPFQKAGCKERTLRCNFDEHIKQHSAAASVADDEKSQQMKELQENLKRKQEPKS